MKMYIWRYGYIGTINIAYADSEGRARKMLKELNKKFPEDTVSLEFDKPAEKFGEKAITLWADVYDLDESP